jgi:hypothetical protein
VALYQRQIFVSLSRVDGHRPPLQKRRLFIDFHFGVQQALKALSIFFREQKSRPPLIGALTVTRKILPQAG